MRKSDVSKYVRKWQRRLYLQDWEIKTVVCDKDDIDGSLARATIVGERRSCTIQVSWPHTNLLGEPDDLEHTIVHELVHCWFDPFYPADPIRHKHKVLVLENAADAIAMALVEADRNSVQ